MAEHSVTGDYYRRIAAARKPVFSIATLAMAVTMTAAIIGASVDTGVLPPIVHAMIAYGAIACNLAAVKIEIDRPHRVQPHRRRGEPPARLVTPALVRARRRFQGLSRSSAAPHSAACRWRRRACRHPRVRSADGRSVRQPRHRRDAAGRGRREPVRPADVRDRRQRRLAGGRRPLRHRQRARRPARCSSLSCRISRCRSRSKSSRRPRMSDARGGAGPRSRPARRHMGCRPVASLDAAGRGRVRLGRALALDPPSCCSNMRAPPSIGNRRGPLRPTCAPSPPAAERRSSRCRQMRRLPTPSPRASQTRAGTGRLKDEGRFAWFRGRLG